MKHQEPAPLLTHTKPKVGTARLLPGCLPTSPQEQEERRERIAALCADMAAKTKESEGP